MLKKFAQKKYLLYLCTRNQEKWLHFRSGIYNAEIAQLVEHNLAKVGVASSSLVFRSKKQRNPLTDICEGVLLYPTFAKLCSNLRLLHSNQKSAHCKISVGR